MERKMTQAEMDGIEIERVTTPVEFTMTIPCGKCRGMVPTVEAEIIGKGRYCVPCAEVINARVLEIVA